MKYIDFVTTIVHKLNSRNVEYMIVGGGSALLQGFNIVTQDIDLYFDKSKQNSEKLVEVLLDLDFNLLDKDIADILKGKDFIQFNEPFELDIMFAPDGFENYKDAYKYKIFIDDFPVMSIEGIIKSKRSANRPKDKAVLKLLIDFNKFKHQKESIETNSEDYYAVPYGYKIADNQTITRWKRNINRSLIERLESGLFK